MPKETRVAARPQTRGSPRLDTMSPAWRTTMTTGDIDVNARELRHDVGLQDYLSYLVRWVTEGIVNTFKTGTQTKADGSA